MDIPMRIAAIPAIQRLQRTRQPGIAIKLWLALMLVGVVLVISLLGLLRWHLGSGFRDYLQQADLARLETLGTVLVSRYARYGDWYWLLDEPNTWRQLLRDHDLSRRRRQAPPPPPPPREGSRRRPPPPPPQRSARRVTLLDAQGLVIQGQPLPPGQQRLPLALNGVTIGWLSIAPRHPSDDQLAMNFVSRQAAFFYLSGAIGLLLASGVAALLARHLVEPLKILTAGTRALTQGHYESRMQFQRQDELGQLAADFDRLAATLEDNERVRRQWMADISHELRTPLAVLRGELEALEDGVRHWDDSARNSLQGEVARLHRLVEDLHELARSELGGLSYRKKQVDLRQSLKTLLAAHGGRLERAGLKLTTDLGSEPLRVFADPDRLGQLFANLLNNSLHYTDAGGELRVSCRRQGQHIKVDFQDSAPAVPHQSLPRLFDRLYRVEGSRNRARGGAGLGLAICENIARAHDGTIQAHPSPLGGVWIALQLPGETTSRE